MTDNTKQWIETAKASSGEKNISEELILGAIDMIENSLEENDWDDCADDLLSLDELNDMLCDFMNEC